MMDFPLSNWRTITATSSMPLYAVLSNVSDAQAVKNYYITDGSQTPYGLYTGTPYEHWFSVMPMLVRLDEHSPFLDWINNTEYKDWGWLARSHLPFETICAHLRSLTQAIMPGGEAVFFRYWDGEYLSIMLDHFTDSWQDVLPAFAFYWINHQSHVVHVPLEQAVQTSPWWQVPESLIQKLLTNKENLLLNNILQTLQESYPNIYWTYRHDVLEKKVKRLLQHNNKNKSDVWNLILQQLQS
ncbi:DUF4123 domain-containing protein [Gilliamella sp. Pas-s25]|uniref:DUF4123 domain-containing protein n=1 Tax=Gilliamella sp. Pas-s25 TaxID=2687310 RepID=UPI00135DAB93|nr:DUF4123 domain-containing protein [Gilliamella sp. Pas-s25]MWP62377.1 DUF4123 domain-containing protein [Gilliamella sp. Pas-s25]